MGKDGLVKKSNVEPKKDEVRPQSPKGTAPPEVVITIPEEVSSVAVRPEASSSKASSLEPLKRKSVKDAATPPEAKKSKADKETSSVSGQKTLSVPPEGSRPKGGSASERLLALRAEESELLLELIGERRSFEQRFEEAEKERERLRAHIKAQHEGFQLMKRDYEGSHKAKVELEQEIDKLKKELDTAQVKQRRSDDMIKDLREKKFEAESLSAELGRKVETEEVKRKILEQDYEAELSRRQKALEQSEGVVKLHTEQMKFLTANLEALVEGWSVRESEWLKGPVNPPSPSIIASDLRRKIIEEYEASAEYETKFNNAISNEFNEGFEYARQLVREKGNDPDAVGIVFPDE